MTLRRGFALEPGERGGGGRGRDHHRRLHARGDGGRDARGARVLAVGQPGRPQRRQRATSACRAAACSRSTCRPMRPTRARCARDGLAAGEAGLARRCALADVRMPAYRVTLAYDGTDFDGLAGAGRGHGRAPCRARSRTALAPLVDAARVAVVAGAGRTDAGVHALGQVASVRARRARWRPSDLRRALNALLPARRARRSASPRVRATASTPAAARARSSTATCSTPGPCSSPPRRRYAGHVPWPLDRDARARRRPRSSSGRHDFASLASAGGSVKTTVRTVTRSEAALRRRRRSSTRWRPTASCARWCAAWWAACVAAGRGAHDRGGAARRPGRPRPAAWPAPAAARGLTLVRVRLPALESGW